MAKSYQNESRVFVGLLTLASVSLLFQNCSQFEAIEMAEKKEFIRTAKVFAPNLAAAAVTAEPSPSPAASPAATPNMNCPLVDGPITPENCPSPTPAPAPAPAEPKEATQPTRQRRQGDPLMVSMNSTSNQAQLLEMLDPDKGLLFDLFGSMNTPVPYQKVEVSWFTAQTIQNKYFITLPDVNGQVLGAEQVFGNYTVGPDGTLARDGFAALAKWDGLRTEGYVDNSICDGIIDTRDPIFRRLRFWNDTNADAVAQPNELRTAFELGIVSIDLRYDPSFFEEDRWGNQARYKSVVKTKDGRMHLLFDLWLTAGN